MIWMAARRFFSLGTVLLVLAALMSPVLVSPALAVNPDEMLDDPVLEARARAISSGLRCLVCQNQTIDDSDAELARDLRLLVRERLVAGDSDAQVVAYLVDRYGEFVLLNPSFSLHNLALWIAAPVVLAIGILVLIWNVRRIRKRNAAMAGAVRMTPEEEEALQSLIEKSDSLNS